jgi:hypothetical protein
MSGYTVELSCTSGLHAKYGYGCVDIHSCGRPICKGCKSHHIANSPFHSHEKKHNKELENPKTKKLASTEIDFNICRAKTDPRHPDNKHKKYDIEIKLFLENYPRKTISSNYKEFCEWVVAVRKAEEDWKTRSRQGKKGMDLAYTEYMKLFPKGDYEKFSKMHGLDGLLKFKLL